ncbi:MAG: GNAT family N-acetyltransferase [Ignavibacteriaceae bacterium]|nr:GNAT family N-acetyltransferase [Ignavibacteriaceae bacterium]
MIRKIKQADAQVLEDMLNRIPNFSQSEVNVAMELISIAANNPQQTDYHLYVYEHEGKVIGYHCTGLRPLTDGTYDLYWIASDPDSGIKGVGNELLLHAENFVKQNSGRWLLAETSSKESYSATRNFYLRNNYVIIAEINDFYSIGDNLIVFGKYFTQ